MTLFRTNTLLLALSASLLAASCGDDDKNNTGNNADAGDNIDTDVDASTQPTTPLWAISSSVRGDSGTASYVVLTDTLEHDGQLSLDDAIEVSGNAVLVGPTEGGTVFMGTNESPEITRYDIVDGELSEGSSVSFLNQGVSAIAPYPTQFHFASPTKAYYFEPQVFQVIVWNPEAMTIIETIDLSIPNGIGDEDVTSFSQNPPVVIGDTVYLPVGWTGPREGNVVPFRSISGVVALDTSNDTATVASYDGCAYAKNGALGSDGKLYIASDAIAGADLYLRPEDASPACMTRFDTATNEFDSEFEIDLVTLAGGRFAGTLVPGADGDGLLRVFEPSEVPDTTPPASRFYSLAPAWHWYSVTLGDVPVATELAGFAAASGSLFVLDAGDSLAIPEWLGSDTFLRLLPGGELANDYALEIQGQLWSIVKAQ